MKSVILVALMALMLLVTGCGVNKDYVAQQIADSEARTGSELGTLRDKTDGNAHEISRLKSLSDELSKKTDMAINEAKGFENYQIIWQGVINFDFDRQDINAAAEQILLQAGEKMQSSPGSIIEIAGHSDRTGSAKYNIMLTAQRANSAKRFLTDQFGLSLYRLFVIAYGETKPVAMPDEKDSASMNRRVNLAVWGKL